MRRIGQFRKRRKRHNTLLRRNAMERRDKKSRTRLASLDEDQDSDWENDYTTILQLPAETMTEIFKLLQLKRALRHHDFGGDGQVTKRRHSDSGWCWITITHVCKGWRDIAISTQELWAYIDISTHANPEQTDLYLERSASSPLQVYYDENGRNSSARESLRLTLQHIYRIQKLHITRLRDLPYLGQIVSDPAPVLEEFSLELDARFVIDITPFFAGQTPRLTSLSLDTLLYKRMKGHHSMMQNLKHFSIHTYLDIGELFSIISLNPNYETLFISSLLPSNNSYEVQSNIITLPSLKSLGIKAEYTVLLQLFKYVNLPAVNDWNIGCEEIPFAVVGHEVVDPKGVIPHTSSTGPLSLTLIMSSKFVTITAKSLNDANGVHFNRSVTYSRYFFLRALGMSGSISDKFNLVCPAIEGEFWCDATELTVKAVSEFKDAKDLRSLGVRTGHWKFLLKMLPKVRKLSVKHVWDDRIARKETHYSLLNALRYHPGRDGSGNMICPELSELQLCGFSLYSADGARPLKLLKKWGRQLSLLRVTKVDKSQSTCAKMRLLEESGVARTIEVDM